MHYSSAAACIGGRATTLLHMHNRRGWGWGFLQRGCTPCLSTAVPLKIASNSHQSVDPLPMFVQQALLLHCSFYGPRCAANDLSKQHCMLFPSILTDGFCCCTFGLAKTEVWSLCVVAWFARCNALLHVQAAEVCGHYHLQTVGCSVQCPE